MKSTSHIKRVTTNIVAFTTIMFGSAAGADLADDIHMSENKITVQKYMDAFSRSDHPAVLSCLTDDVEWLIPGAFHLHGKAAFDKEIQNDAFVGSPTIKVSRVTKRTTL